ncbi:MAG: hypothetical protein LQ340_001128 [Diploschistes diacapsis]|nr:MAG: hypothetical protein LQ340_001128 [Diploschistes diacapsis]
MSVLGADIHNVLTQLLTGLSSSENDVRSRAEEQLNTEWVAGRPDVLLMGLVEQMHDSPDPSTRSFAAVLFRRMANKTRKVPNKSDPTELFMTLQEPQQLAIRSRLLLCMQSETIGHVRNKVGDAVAEIARQYSDDGMLPRENSARSKGTFLIDTLQASHGPSFSAHSFKQVSPPKPDKGRAPSGYLRQRPG